MESSEQGPDFLKVKNIVKVACKGYFLGKMHVYEEEKRRVSKTKQWYTPAFHCKRLSAGHTMNTTDLDRLSVI